MTPTKENRDYAKENAQVELLAIRAELERLRERVDQALSVMATTQASIKPAEPIENLNLPRRALTCLHKAGIETVGQLAEKAYRDLWQMNNCGRYTVRDIALALQARGLCLKGNYYDLGCWHSKRTCETNPSVEAVRE
jgi:DNA-directed RNA polymerase alpha subunit